MNGLKLTQTQTARVAALAAGVNTKDAAAALHDIRLSISGTELIAMATDRYSITEYRTPIEASGEFVIYLNPEAVKFAAASAKAKQGIVITETDGTIQLRTASGSMYEYAQKTQIFPDIATLMERAKARADEQAGIAYRLSAARLDTLNKLAKAFSKDASYLVSSSPESERKTASPVLYQMRAAELGTDALAVLVQPMLRDA